MTAMTRRRRLVAGAAALAAGGIAVRRLRGGGERVDLVYADGSSLSLPDTHYDAQRLLPFGRDILHLIRDR
jgi:hypothetical protein